jgi:hypothetical protein
MASSLLGGLRPFAQAFATADIGSMLVPMTTEGEF